MSLLSSLLHPSRQKRVLPLLAAMLVAALALAAGALAQEDEPEPTPAERARQSTVFLMQTYESAGTQILSCVGSGTIVDESGLILTNAHLASSLGPCRGERIIVALPVRLDEPPVPTYLAEPVALDEGLDLAVLQVTGSLDGSLVDTEVLNLPAVTLGDPSTLLPGSAMSVVGYPDLSTSSVTHVPGVVTGITAEKAGGSMAWLRTDSELGGAMAGGGAYNADGQLVGIGTSAPGTSGNAPGPMCISVQDNTRDSLITEADTCVPIGGDVTAVRPIVFARPLIESAQRGLQMEHMSGLPTNPPVEEPSVSRLFFSTGVSGNGHPVDVVTALPSGSTSLFLFFDYANVPAGTPYEVRVTRDGIDMPQFSLGPLAWGGGPSGTWYMGTEGKTWPDGSYEFTILLNGQIAASHSITVGAAPDPQQFRNLTFGLPTAAGSLEQPGVLFPAGITQLAAQFEFSGMRDTQQWREVWYLNGSPIFDETRTWSAGSDGQTTASINAEEGLPLGNYRLELFIGDRLAATGDVALAGTASADGTPRIFADTQVSSELARDGSPAGQVGSSGLTMPLGVNSIYAFTDWDAIPNGLDWTYRWFLDGRLIASSTERWDAGGIGEDYWISLSSDSALPEGEYTIELLVKNRPMYSASVAVGSGAQPISGVEAESDEVFVEGHVIDALTGEGIPDALVIVLDVMLESPSFTWDESEIHTQAVSDRQGTFSLPRGLPRGNYYTMYVFAEDYITIVEDNLTILRTQESPASMTIEMTRP